MSKPQLVLDIGGVLAANFSPLFWQELAAKAMIPYDDLIDLFKRDLREPLWSGAMSEEAFWTSLCARFPSIDREHARMMLISYLKPLPAMVHLPAWSQAADIHLLSNHRIEWVAPVVSAVQHCVRSMTISSSAGCCKPHPDIYAFAASQLAAGQPVLFVDDQEKNLRQASVLGWKTLLADADGMWIERVLPLLLEPRDT